VAHPKKRTETGQNNHLNSSRGVPVCSRKTGSRKGYRVVVAGYAGIMIKEQKVAVQAHKCVAVKFHRQ